MSAEFPKTSLVPIGDIVVGEYLTDTNSRGKDLGDIEGLSMSIAADGLLSPLIVVADAKESGRRVFHLIAGRRRLEAIKLIRKDVKGAFAKIPVLRFEGDVTSALIANLAENLQREDPDPMAVAESVARLVNDSGLTAGVVAERLGKSRPWVQDRLLLAAGKGTAVGDAVQAGDISGTAGVEVMRAPEETREEILGDAVDSGGTVQDVREAKANRAPPTQKETDEAVTKGQKSTPPHTTVSSRPPLTELRQFRDDFEGMSGKTAAKEARRLAVIETISWVLGQAKAPVL